MNWTREDLAWFPGLVEGEGCFMWSGKTLKLKITMCDEDVLRRVHRIIGGTLSGPTAPSGLGKKPRWHWVANGRFAYALIVAILPWMMVRRSEAARRAVRGWLAVDPYARHKLRPDDIRVIRFECAWGAPYRVMAERFNVSIANIGHIVQGRNWRSIPR